MHAVFVRSTVAHGTLRSVDTAAAAGLPGVVAALTADDLDLPEQGRARLGALARPLLAVDRVRFVGEAVAVVVAESYAAAVDATEAVVVDVEPLPVVIDPVRAASDGATLLFPGHGTNVAGGRHHDADDAFFADDDVVVSARLVHQRIAPVPMESNGALAVPAADGSLTLWASTQGVFGVRDEVCTILGLAPEQVRVRAPWVGGGFGAKGGTYPEQVLVAALARRLGRPVRWVETRTENLVGMTHGRAQVHDMTVGARRDGTLGGLRVRGWADVGAYPVRGAFIPMVTRFMSAGVYRWQRHDFSAVAVVTNATPTGPYRGAGRPEAAALCERAVDLVAAELGMDPAEVRRRNFPAPDEFPFTTVTGAVYDTGDYAKSLDTALELVGYEQLARGAAQPTPASRRALARDRHRLLRRDFGKRRGVRRGRCGRRRHHRRDIGQRSRTVKGTRPCGRRSPAPRSGFRSSRCESCTRTRAASTTGPARSGRGRCSSPALPCCERPKKCSFRRGRWWLICSRPHSTTWSCSTTGGLASPVCPRPVGRGPSLRSSLVNVGARSPTRSTSSRSGTFPFGCHVAVVEIDQETGRVAIQDLVAVDDCGTVINPLLAAGQVHGGLAQGIAQMLFEEVRYDDGRQPAHGNPHRLRRAVGG